MTDPIGGDTPATHPRLNDGLYRAHRALFIFYALVLSLLLLACAWNLVDDGSGFGLIPFVMCLLFVGPIATAHGFAARGARLGKPWGRTISRAVAVLLLFGVPIGTLIGIYILYQTGDGRWRDGEGPVSA